MTRTTAYLGLGSNLGDRAATLASALAAVAARPEIELEATSTIVETEPLLAPGAPAAPAAAPAGRYLNAAARVTTTLDARRLLAACLAIEADHGRVRSPAARWAPRTLDIDLLLFGDSVIDEPGLVVPHPQLHTRSFVLVPLAEIAPRLVHPVLGRSIECLRDSGAADDTTRHPHPPSPDSDGRMRPGHALDAGGGRAGR
jgi:2-amino-4-hydroxy-6-hydroxymethyldihydropteridine diphosphokinase